MHFCRDCQRVIAMAECGRCRKGATVQEIIEKPGHFYVSALDNEKLMGLAAGPFKTHLEALVMVRACQNEGSDRDPRATFWAWGTMRALDANINGLPVGVLNDYFCLEQNGDGTVNAPEDILQRAKGQAA